MTFIKSFAVLATASFALIGSAYAEGQRPDPVSGPNYRLVSPAHGNQMARYVYYENGDHTHQRSAHTDSSENALQNSKPRGSGFRARLTERRPGCSPTFQSCTLAGDIGGAIALGIFQILRSR